MAAEITPQTQTEINECLRTKQNFLLSGGAGSGKTYSLVETVKYIFTSIDKNARVACITYTNVAADEIKTRVPYDGLWVSTVHEFLWNEIKSFQNNLKQQFLKLTTANKETDIDASTIQKVEYRNYSKHAQGIISHDDVLKLSEQMFEYYPLLSRILCNRYDYIFIDEYQDTSPLAMKIFLSLITQYATNQVCIGMFGDRMQSIYASGIESSATDGMEQYKSKYKEIIKEDNYRSSPKIINVINQIRNDSVQQKALGENANYSGEVKFVYSNQSFNIEHIKTKLPFMYKWNLQDPDNTKILALTHGINAQLDGFSDLRNLYICNPALKSAANDRLFGDEPDAFAALLLRIAGILESFENKDYKTLLSPKYIDIVISNNTVKHDVATALNNTVNNYCTETIGDVIKIFRDSGIVNCGDIIKQYSKIEDYADFYEKASKLSAVNIKHYWRYYNKYSPFSTQHGVKGAQFENVLVDLDNGRWNQYNFSYLFENTKGKKAIIKRTRKIFYVCCSRAQRDLVVFMRSPSPQALACANRWFGEQECINLDEG